VKEILLMYARYNQRANASVVALLDGLTAKARNETRKSYYGSLSGLASHTGGCALYFHGMFRASFPAAARALKAAEGLDIPDAKTLTIAAWSELKKAWAIADQATIDLISALSEKELSHPIKLDWYGGKPDSVPMCFLAHQLFVHGTHHRGQISQILDEMGVQHDFSGIDLEFLPL
jgi:uncharacterized damage-inducible protein DinB